MGFSGFLFDFDPAASKASGGKPTASADLLHKSQCSACPLNNVTGCKHPKMDATGADRPLVYMLGTAPDADEDEAGAQFYSEAGELVTSRIKPDWLDHVRFNNVVRTKPPKERAPTWTEIECCRPSVVRDIEETKPVAIFGFGVAPLSWAIEENSISKWRGRRIPIKVGKHRCWYFPMLDPQKVLDARPKWFTPSNNKKYGSDEEFVFHVDLERAFKTVDNLPPWSDADIHTPEMAKENITVITGANGKNDLNAILKHLKTFYDDKVVGLDYETNAIRPYGKSAKILSAAVSGHRSTLAFPFRHREATWTAHELQILEDAWYDFLTKAPCRKVSHQLSFEAEWSAVNFGRKTLRAQPWECSLSQAFILDERRGTHSLDFLCLEHFGLRLKGITNLDRAKLDSEPLEDVLLYNGLDAKYHRNLHFVQTQRLKEQKLSKVYAHHLRRIPTVVLTQIKGIPIDQDVVAEFTKKFGKKQAKAEAMIDGLGSCLTKFKRTFGKEFQPSSNVDVKRMLVKVLGIPAEKTDEKVLATIEHPIANAVLAWRKPTKVLSTYLLPVTEGSPLVYDDGKVHPIISTTNTRTWRTASEDPNSQNWPKRGPNKEIRRCVQRAGDKIVAFDYAGIQARNVAMESEDPTLVKSFWDRYDIHTDWLELLVKKYPKFIKEGARGLNDKAVRKEYRDIVKNKFVFPSFFGAQPKSMSLNLGVPEEKVQELHEHFWDRFPEIKVWHKAVVRDFYRTGYVTGLSGFRRRAPIQRNEMINAPIQADETVIVLAAMARLSEMEEWRFQANMEIHDDLTFIWPKRDVERNAEIVIREMLRLEYDWINVPLQVEMSVGDDWCNLEAAGEFASDTWEKQ